MIKSKKQQEVCSNQLSVDALNYISNISSTDQSIKVGDKNNAYTKTNEQSYKKKTRFENSLSLYVKNGQDKVFR